MPDTKNAIAIRLEALSIARTSNVFELVAVTKWGPNTFEIGTWGATRNMLTMEQATDKIWDMAEKARNREIF